MNTYNILYLSQIGYLSTIDLSTIPRDLGDKTMVDKLMYIVHP